MIHHSRPELGDAEKKACARVIDSGYLASGPETRAFEEELAERFQRREAVCVSSGFGALHLSLLVLGGCDGQKVMIPSYCCTALLNAVRISGGLPLVVDTPWMGTHLDAKRDVGDDVVIAPQMFGVVQDLSSLPQGRLIEDGAMSVGPTALRQGKVAITSFYATKMMTTAQGGAILTDDEALASQLRDLIAYDNREDDRLRFNYAPNDLCSAVGRVQLERLDGFLERRQCLGESYDAFFKKKLPHLLAHPEGLTTLSSGLFRYWIRVRDAKALAAALAEEGIEAKSPVFRPLHRYLGLSDDDFPATTTSQREVLSLPFYPGLREEDQVKVCDVLEKLSHSGIF